MNIFLNIDCDIPKTFNVIKAANSVDIDIEKKSKYTLNIKDVDIDSDYNIGLILGPSGSGKTSICKNLFGNNCFNEILDPSLPVIEQFSKDLEYDTIVNYLTAVGLSQVPCWIRPAYTLSTGQKARAEIALQLSKKDVIYIDEWTSTVDRNVAKIMSHTVNKFVKKYNKKIILLSCHYDIVEWLKPDWVIDCGLEKFTNHRGSLWQRKEQFKFDVKPCSRDPWKYYSKYHYLGENFPGGKSYCFGLFNGETQIGFGAYSNYNPKNQNVLHSHRVVINPDYCGIGLGLKFIDITAKFLKTKYNYKIKSKSSSIALTKARLKNNNWKLENVDNNFIKTHMRRGVRKNVKTYTFSFIG